MGILRIAGVAAFVLLGIKYLRPGGIPLFSIAVLFIMIGALNTRYRNQLGTHARMLFAVFACYFFLQLVDLLRSADFQQSVSDLIKYLGLIVSLILFSLFYRYQRLMSDTRVFAILASLLLLYFFFNSLLVLKSGFLSADLFIRTEKGKNGLAMFSAIVFIVSFWMLVSTSIRYRYLYFLPCIFISISSLIYTQSRGAFFVLLISSLLVYVLFLYRRSGERLYRLFKMSVAIGLFVVFLMYVFTAFNFFDEKAYFEQLTSLGTGRLTGSDEARRTLLEKGWRLFIDNPIIGIGTHNFEYRYELLTHNQYLQFAAENGFFMAIAVIVVFLLITSNFFRRQKANSSNTLFHIAFNTSLFIFVYFIFINAYDSILTEFCLIIGARVLDDSNPYTNKNLNVPA